jgi:hypothetical protein
MVIYFTLKRNNNDNDNNNNKLGAKIKPSPKNLCRPTSEKTLTADNIHQNIGVT